MYKKAGLVVGILLVIAAIVVFIVAKTTQESANTSSEDGNIPQSSVSISQDTGTSAVVQQTNTPIVAPATTQTTTMATTSTAPVTQTEATPVENEPVQSEPENTGVTLSPDQTIITRIDASTLPSYIDETDLGTVVGRKVYAVNNQVIFSLLINTTTHGQLEYFTTLKNYNLADGTRLECTLRVYKAQNGDFASIISVTSV